MIPFARVLKYGNTAVVPAQTEIKTYRMGSSHMVLLDSTGTLWGIGYNTQGQFGFPNDASYNSVGKWTKIYENVRLVTAVQDFTVIVTNDNRIMYCGYNLVVTTPSYAWVDITPYMNGVVVSDIDALFSTAGMLHIRTTDGSLYAYGRNHNVNSGVEGMTGAVGLAMKVVLPGAVKDIRYTIAAGTVLCQLTSSSIYGWGRNANGELGQGNTTSVPTPIRISTTAITMGASYSACGISTGGVIMTAGNQYSGQIGNGSTVASHVNITTYASRTYPGSANTIRSPIDGSTAFTMAFMSPEGIYYTGTSRVPFGGANGAVTVGVLTKCSDLPIAFSDVQEWCSGTIGGVICSKTELYQCGNGLYIAGDGQNAGRYGFRKTPLPWDDY